MSALLHFFGAAGCVTGSCALLETDKTKILVDCGMFQGAKTLKELNYQEFPFDPEKIDGVLLTHAHIDHSGLLPKLDLAGFRGPVYATAGTRDLCAVLLPDAGAIQEMEVLALNRRNKRRGWPEVSPIYTRADARDCLRLFQTVRFDEWIDLGKGARARWWNAGHILGAASIEIEIQSATGDRDMKLLFSGDIGPGGRDVTEDPEGPSGVDHVIMEATYGDVERATIKTQDRLAALKEVVMKAHDAGGPLLIPAFAVERTQELIVDLLELMEQGSVPACPVFLDSPLAIKASDVFLKHGKNGKGDNPFAALGRQSVLRFTESADESRDLERFAGWHIIIAASGMCDAGRVRHHLKRLLWRKEASVLIVGYQAIGTLGRLLLDGKSHVRIQGEDIKVRASIRDIDVYSGHADAIGLTAWAKARAPVSGSIFLTHGEPENLKGLARRLKQDGHPADQIIIAGLDQAYRLRPAQTGIGTNIHRPRIDPDSASSLDWHNRRIEFLQCLDAELAQASDDRARQILLSKLETALKRAPTH
jgi:metallo-beta-lactamase family protein